MVWSLLYDENMHRKRWCPPNHLEKYGVAIKPPEVGYWVSAVPSTGNQLQSGMTVGACFLCKARGENINIGSTPDPFERTEGRLLDGGNSGLQGRPRPRPRGLTLLLQPRLVADGRPQLQAGAIGQGAGLRTHHHAQAGLLEDVAVVVVGVAHGPAAQVALRLLLIAAVDEAHVAIRPLAEVVEVGWLLDRRTKRRAVKSTKTKPSTLRF